MLSELLQKVGKEQSSLEGEGCQGTVRLVTRCSLEPSAPEVVFEKLAQWCLRTDVHVVDNGLRVVENKVTTHTVGEADDGSNGHDAGT